MQTAGPHPPPDPHRIHYLDYLRGLAVILVVAGHYFPAQSPQIWKDARTLIYLFHMPAFFFLSGYLFCGELARGGGAQLSGIVKKKAARLLLPWASAAAGYLLIKLILPFFMNLGEPLTAETLINLVREPRNSYVPVIWFLQALFIVTVMFLVLRVRLGVSPQLILVLFFLLSFIRFPAYFSFDDAVQHMQFFALGNVMCLHSLDKRIAKKFLLLAVPVFAVNAGFCLADPDNVPARLVGAYSGVIAMVFVSMLLARFRSGTACPLERVSHCAMGIYLLHPYPVGAVAALCHRRLALPDNLFFLGLAAAVAAGAGAGAVIDKYLLRRHRITRKVVLGMKG